MNHVTKQSLLLLLLLLVVLHEDIKETIITSITTNNINT